MPFDPAMNMPSEAQLRLNVSDAPRPAAGVYLLAAHRTPYSDGAHLRERGRALSLFYTEFELSKTM
jgi:hypothetical protein